MRRWSWQVVMKVESERTRDRSKWTLETNAIVDRAFAAIIFAVIAVVLHIAGVDATVLHEVGRLLP
jgi:hypothetical protein